MAFNLVSSSSEAQTMTSNGAVSLIPNALRVMDSIGAYSRIKHKGFNFEAMTFMTDPEHEVTGKLYFGQKDVYEYDGIRITRKVLIHEPREMVIEAGIEIYYGKKFSKVISEDDNDGSRGTAEILIGADGIHSKVRSYLFPSIYPEYEGFLGLTYCFPRANTQLDDEFPLPVSLRGQHGSFIITPQAENGNEVFVGRQYKYEPQDR
ncbi:Monooxygenase FAD-binding [Penicillium macrosclerotiorum]|uniref:Monooxygenase FAD-binding n=1 Tax=Penicillium macrosclerotiorum TaxID=303699 RepID=UPI002546A1ED|nr:Monooxygenase FAD-binding [Penicillium macrosclerotiorum]KAJ5688507.1 Monooxygenase FAD-binding [Penicillium macrosclerotiorum]